jgi:hypothetical protein
MSRRQHIMALFLAAILFSAIIATAAKTQSPGLARPQVDLPIRWSSAPKILPIDRSKMTSKAKIPLQPTKPFPSHKSNSTPDQGAVWGQGPAYDLSQTSRSSIYVLFTPDPNE